MCPKNSLTYVETKISTLYSVYTEYILQSSIAALLFLHPLAVKIKKGKPHHLVLTFTVVYVCVCTLYTSLLVNLFTYFYSCKFLATEQFLSVL